MQKNIKYFKKKNKQNLFNLKFKNFLLVGKIGKVYGIRGWLKIFSYTEKKENIFNYQPWFIINKIKKKIILEDWKKINDNLVIKIKNIDDRQISMFFTNHKIYVNKFDLPNLSKNEFYWKDILGCKIININGYEMGIVTNLIQTKFNDVLIVKSNLKDFFKIKEILIPFIRNKVIKKVFLKKKIIKVDWDPNF